MSDSTSLVKPVAKAALTLAAVAAAAVLVTALWRAYVLAPWTRDGRVSAQVVRIAPEVAGTVVKVNVKDNQKVRRGEVLYQIDPERFRLAIGQAEAQLEAARITLRQKTEDAGRRRGMDDLISGEDIRRSTQAVDLAKAELHHARVALDIAQLDLERTTLRAPVDGYVTHLRLREGDYASVGQPNVALLDTNSFWITGYFEETRLHAIRPGAPVQIRLMGYTPLLAGHVASIGRGITDSNAQDDARGLPEVEASFSWVRLAQRIPVRVEIDRLPPGVELVAGMTCSLEVGKPEELAVHRGLLATLLHRLM